MQHANQKLTLQPYRYCSIWIIHFYINIFSLYCIRFSKKKVHGPVLYTASTEFIEIGGSTIRLCTVYTFKRRKGQKKNHSYIGNVFFSYHSQIFTSFFYIEILLVPFFFPTISFIPCFNPISCIVHTYKWKSLYFNCTM